MNLSPTKFFLKKQNLKIIFFLALILINFFVFFPSFFHVARHDQLLYVGDLSGDNSWISLAIKKAVTYNRDQHLFPGHDPMLFRPLFYFLLGTELWIFQYNFVLWQITGFLLHLAVLWFFLGLLWQIRESIFAGLLVLFFSVLYANVEMVIWHHVNSYMIFVALTLFCFKIFYRIICDRRVTSRQAWFLFFSLLISSLIYEGAFLYSLFFFVFSKLFLSPHRNEKKLASRHWRVMILAPAIIYLSLNLLTLFLKWNTISKGASSLKTFSAASSIKAVFASSWWWISEGLFPELLKPALQQRIVFYYNGAFLGLKNIFSLQNILSIGFLSLFGSILIYLILLQKSLSKNFIRERYKFIILILGIWTIQIIVLAVGRIASGGLSLLANCSYYNYLFWPYPIILVYSLIDFKKQSCRHKILNVRNLSILFLATLIAINGTRTWALNDRYRRVWKKQFLVTRKIQNLVKSHRNEKNFSFTVDERDRLYLPWIHKTHPLLSEEPYFYSQMLYPSLINENNPKYTISFTEKERQEITQTSLEGTLENLSEKPILVWGVSDLKLFFFLTNLYLQQGEKEKALRLIDRILSLNPHPKEFRKTLESQKNFIEKKF
ncbi:MAG: hypothetical protein P9M07_04855 [Candidatus Aceula meridiana]|nr:hypothetical protein [Candidatus Aceula meridiana]